MKEETAKEKVIREAYINEFTSDEQDKNKRFYYLKNYIDEYGWFCGNLHDIDEDRFDRSGHEIRPKSINGIENNNGWIRIESEADLPKKGYYEVIIRKTGEKTRATLDNEFRTKSIAIYYSHYQAIIDIPSPLY